jgi:[acyl-carrier-protein] S-malonyltransferase
MAAVLGLSPEAVEAVVEKLRAENCAGIYAANLNSPRQTVVSGTKEALTEAEPRFKEAGAKRVIPLQVSGPFHSPFMESAAQKFAEALSAVTFHDAAIPFFSNVTGTSVTSGAEIKALALKQITSPVRWTAIEAGVAALRPDAVLECGPGKTLCGLWNDFCGDIPCYAMGTQNDIEGSSY